LENYFKVILFFFYERQKEEQMEQKKKKRMTAKQAQKNKVLINKIIFNPTPALLLLYL